ncbi:Hypothetical predicted protein [Marmota monax]|uniref:Uncharacterized protein n=1 Tax=Marmota monax TaxID=9995 RepID=A0A5E4AN34_MARMO|nr:Hypothetical predicted protein [Marmota monax]
MEGVETEGLADEEASKPPPVPERPQNFRASLKANDAFLTRAKRSEKMGNPFLGGFAEAGKTAIPSLDPSLKTAVSSSLSQKSLPSKREKNKQSSEPGLKSRYGTDAKRRVPASSCQGGQPASSRRGAKELKESYFPPNRCIKKKSLLF